MLSCRHLLEACLWFVFFFQAEDGIRDHCVTGVQTCALPIYGIPFLHVDRGRPPGGMVSHPSARDCGARGGGGRSEERRVGKERRSRAWLWYLLNMIMNVTLIVLIFSVSRLLIVVVRLVAFIR